VGQSLIALIIFLIYAEHQIPDATDIEQKLFTLAIWIWVRTLY